MSQNWDFYMCYVDSKPASIYLDLDATEGLQVEQFPYRAYVRVYMRSPRADGLSSQEEYSALIQLEDELLDRFEATERAIFVGRNTSDGCRDFYFYLTDESVLEPAVQAVMSTFQDYEFEFGADHDPQWHTYFSFLYPSAEDMQRIQNRRVCTSIEEAGDAFSTERPIEHWAYFPTAEARAAYIETALGLGYTWQANFEPEAADERYGVRVSGNGIPSFAGIDDLTLPLFRAANEHGGDYDGWETQVLK